MISIDDFQPPFKYADGQGCRISFYIAEDLGSGAITCWVYGDAKKGLITEFYRQLVINYAEWGLKMPAQLECESNLNSSFADTFLQPGAMFQHVRIIANDARQKRIERTIGRFRNEIFSKQEGFVPRFYARAEHLQEAPGKKVNVPKDEIVDRVLRAIEDWNNSPHPNQELHPGMCRWDVFMQKQHPDIMPTNWAAILPHIGRHETTSMNLGRIRACHQSRVVGYGTQVATGDTLIEIMSQIEGKEVDVYYLAQKGKMIKGQVYNKEGIYICDLLGDLWFARAIIERTPECAVNEPLFHAYKATVTSYINSGGKQISRLEVTEEKQLSTAFKMPGLQRYIVDPEAPAAERMPAINTEDEDEEVYAPVQHNYKLDSNTY